MSKISFKLVRIVLLLALLAWVYFYTQHQQTNMTLWYKPIEVIIYPINGDHSSKTENYIKQLNEGDFSDIDDFFTRSSHRYHLITIQPFYTTLGHEIKSIPPAVPHDSNPSVLNAVSWSLKTRLWAFRHTPDTSTSDNIRLYVVYHQPDEAQTLPHSIGLQDGLIGVVHAFADPLQNHENNVVMAHEILHTVGATDKYDQHNQPLYPIGYAQPHKTPLYPQQFAEIMAGRIPLSETQSKMPPDLNEVVVGKVTAREIHWLKSSP